MNKYRILTSLGRVIFALSPTRADAVDLVDALLQADFSERKLIALANRNNNTLSNIIPMDVVTSVTTLWSVA